jgi:NAD(P)-dependent dehydrogenase (short-subunit alcohol dehydrogenase family)
MSARKTKKPSPPKVAPPVPAMPRVLDGRVALVTGAGSGLGRGIAEGLGRAGAKVALVDIDLAAAEHACVNLVREFGGSSCLCIKADVTDEAQVADAFRQTVEEFGRLDICVPAAGIAPAFSLVDFPVEPWRKALEINLTGYFLAAREAARTMIAGGRGGSIILVSSKSGVEASKANSAYNATKAGELHLARGWALELGPAGIRVNAVAPGNVFKGSKIWNQEYIKACAKKRGKNYVVGIAELNARAN